MPTIYDQRNSLDRSVKIFDSFYSVSLNVPADKFDIVYGYFVNICKTKKIAANFTAILFRIAQEAGIDVLELLDGLKGAPNKLQMNKNIVYYLNTFRSKTALYGTGLVPKPNQAVARNVVI
jgi:hypothetical protein